MTYALTPCLDSPIAAHVCSLSDSGRRAQPLTRPDPSRTAGGVARFRFVRACDPGVSRLLARCRRLDLCITLFLWAGEGVIRWCERQDRTCLVQEPAHLFRHAAGRHLVGRRGHEMCERERPGHSSCARWLTRSARIQLEGGTAAVARGLVATRRDVAHRVDHHQ